MATRKMTTGPKKAVTPASRAAATDKMKKAAAVNVKPGQKLAKSGQSKTNQGTDMRQAQIAAAKAKAAEWSKRHGGLPATPENVRKYGK
jgi:hypothetical protein